MQESNRLRPQPPELVLLKGGLSDQPLPEQISAEPVKAVDNVSSSPYADYSEVADIIKIDKNGRGHRESFSPEAINRTGQFTSYYEMDQIVANQDLIRSGLNVWKTSKKILSHLGVFPVISKVPSKRNVKAGDSGGPGRTDWQREFPLEMAYDLGTSLNEYTRLAALRERSAFSSRATKKKVEKARESYEILHQDSQKWSLNKMNEFGFESKERLKVIIKEDKTEAKHLAMGIKDYAERFAKPKRQISIYRQKLANRRNRPGHQANNIDVKAYEDKPTIREKVYDWWARQGGGDKFFSRQRLVGTANKAALIGVLGLPVGIVAGAAGVFLAGPIVGAAIGTGVGRSVGRGLMRARIDKNANAKNVASAQFEVRLAAQYQNIEQYYKRNRSRLKNQLLPSSVTDVYAEGTEKGVRRNRRRLIGGLAIGAAGGIAGSLIGEFAHEIFDDSDRLSIPNIKPKLPTIPPDVDLYPPVLPAPPDIDIKPVIPKISPDLDDLKPITRPLALHGRIGKEFKIEPGSGIISEIYDYARSHRYSHITPLKADQVYLELHDKFGRDIIKLDTGNSTYLVGDDVRLSHPGPGHWWSPEVELELREDLAKAAA